MIVFHSPGMGFMMNSPSGPEMIIKLKSYKNIFRHNIVWKIQLLKKSLFKIIKLQRLQKIPKFFNVPFMQFNILS